MQRMPVALAGLLACVLGAAAPGARTLDDIKLSGCVVQGEGDDAGYLLTNAPAELGSQPSGEPQTAAPSALGTSGRFATIFYWLDGDDDLKKHVGHRVEIEGDVEGDLREGEIQVDRKDKWTEVAVKSSGRSMKANVPHTSLLPAPGDSGDRKNDVLVRRVNVEKVRMLTASCEP